MIVINWNWFDNSLCKIKITMISNWEEWYNAKYEKINKEKEFSELRFSRKQFPRWIDVEMYFSSS